jgi:hypothetical protein
MRRDCFDRINRSNPFEVILCSFASATDRAVSRFRTDIVDSGNNPLGLARVEAVKRKSRGSSK